MESPRKTLDRQAGLSRTKNLRHYLWSDPLVPLLINQLISLQNRSGKEKVRRRGREDRRGEVRGGIRGDIGGAWKARKEDFPQCSLPGEGQGSKLLPKVKQEGWRWWCYWFPLGNPLGGEGSNKLEF